MSLLTLALPASSCGSMVRRLPQLPKSLQPNSSWQGIDFLRLLHHGIVNAYLLAGWEEFADYLFLLFGIERRSYLVHDVGKVWLEDSDCLTDGINVPDEDSGIPIVIASGKVLLGCLQVWLFLESLYLVDFIYGCWLCCGYIAIACFWAAWLNTDGYDGVLIGSIAQCLAQYSLILGGIDHQSIGWCHHDVGCRMLFLDLSAGIGDTRCSIASLWF